jgi:hypothetical protein
LVNYIITVVTGRDLEAFRLNCGYTSRAYIQKVLIVVCFPLKGNNIKQEGGAEPFELSEADVLQAPESAISDD